MRILMFLSKSYMVDPRVQKEAMTLAEQGHEIAVIVWDRHLEYRPEDIVDGIHLYHIHNTSLMQVAPNDLFRNPLWWRTAYKKARQLFKEGFPFDVVHCHDLDTLQIGVWLKRKFNVKLIYDAHELWGYLIEKDVPRFVVRRTFALEKRLVQHADHIITVSPPFVDYFSALTKKPITLVMNCKDLRYKNYAPPKDDVFNLLYIGGMKKRRFFPEIIDIMGNMKEARLTLAGKIEDLYYQMKEYSEKYDNVAFLGTIPTKEILPLTRSCHATFIIVDPSSNHYQRTLFNKQFEAMVCGRPIIVTRGTYAGTMTDDLQCGLTVDYTKESVTKAIIRLRDNPQLCRSLGENALKAAKEQYNWENERKKLHRVYEEI
jgi:glycosyltransferase involved in cell wall biosynthesis